jgi:hypothetical protein
MTKFSQQECEKRHSTHNKVTVNFRLTCPAQAVTVQHYRLSEYIIGQINIVLHQFSGFEWHGPASISAFTRIFSQPSVQQLK